MPVTAGKSTLINALVGHDLMPVNNVPGMQSIVESVIHKDSDLFIPCGFSTGVSYVVGLRITNN